MCSAAPDEAFAYLKATNGGRISDDVIRTISNGMAEAEGFLRDLADGSGAEITTRRRVATTPFRIANPSTIAMSTPSPTSMPRLFSHR